MSNMINNLFPDDFVSFDPNDDIVDVKASTQQTYFTPIVERHHWHCWCGSGVSKCESKII